MGNQDVPTFTDTQKTLENLCLWKLYVDKSSNVNKEEARTVLIAPDGFVVKQTLELTFHYNSTMIFNQVKWDYAAHDPTIEFYMTKAKALLEGFEKYKI
ncbi:hypothetical protein ACFX13_019352 [Malus domestica]